MTSENQTTIGFIGAGRMATALATGLAKSFTAPDKIIATDPFAAARDAFVEVTGCRVAADNADVFAAADVIVLAVKPQVMPQVLAAARETIRPDQLVVSIAAGVTISTIATALNSDRIIRVMPNTPCLIGHGASAYALGESAGQQDGQLVQQMLETVGIAVQVPEYQLDAVTGLSGSGPAYVYQMIEALSDGGVRVGLPRSTATQLAAQTLLGAAAMVLQTAEHPGALKDAVTSPGGTTIAGLHALENGGLRAALMNAVQAATERATELG